MSNNTFPTNSDLSAAIGKFVRLAAGTRSLEVNTTSGSASLGVLIHVYTIGAIQYGEVSNGIDFVSVVAGDSFVVGERLSVDGSGRAGKWSAGAPILGLAARAVSVVGALFQMQPFNVNTPLGGGGFPTEGTLTSSIVDGPTLTAAATASCIPPGNVLILPANYFSSTSDSPRGLLIRAAGRISSPITTPGTATFFVRLGPGANITVFDSKDILLDSVAAHVTVGWSLVIYLSLRSVGPVTAAKFWGSGLWTSEDLLGTPATAPKGSLTAVLPWNQAPALGTGFDSTVANTLDLMFTQTVATGSFTVHQYTVEAF